MEKDRRFTATSPPKRSVTSFTSSIGPERPASVTSAPSPRRRLGAGRSQFHENSRIPMIPSRRKMMTTIRSTEKRTIRIPGMPGMCSEPRVMGFSTNRSHSSIVVTRTEPIREPVMEPRPPTTTIISRL